MGLDSLRIALASGGMTHALVSWQDNAFVEQATAGIPWLTRLVWVSPKGPESTTSAPGWPPVPSG